MSRFISNLNDQTEGRHPRPSATLRTRQDNTARRAFFVFTLLPVLLILFVTGALLVRAWPIISAYGLSDLIFGEVWKPNNGQFGFWPFILGTFWVTAVGAILAVPACLLASIYLAEYAHARTRALAKPVLDLLAAIPPVGRAAPRPQPSRHSTARVQRQVAALPPPANTGGGSGAITAAIFAGVILLAAGAGIAAALFLSRGDDADGGSPSPTPLPSLTAPAATPTTTPTRAPAATNTPAPSQTATPSPSATPATAEATPTRTATRPPQATPTRTNTPPAAPPTATPTPPGSLLTPIVPRP